MMSLIKYGIFLFFILLNSASKVSALVNIEQLLEDLYQTVDGHSISEKEIRLIKNAGGNATYGEITCNSLQELLNYLKPTRKDVFYDLGSGVGKLALHVYLTTPVKACIGIELSAVRNNNALIIKHRLERRDYLDRKRVLTFKEENFLDANLSDATIIYLCSTCYPDDCMQKLTEKFVKLKKGLRVVTLRKLPKNDKFELLDELKLNMTWSKNVSVYIYELK